MDHDEGHTLVAERCQEFLAVQVNLSNLVRGRRGRVYCRAWVAGAQQRRWRRPVLEG